VIADTGLLQMSHSTLEALKETPVGVASFLE